MYDEKYGEFLLQEAQKKGYVLISEYRSYIDNYVELKYIYPNEEYQNHHCKMKENIGYKCYQLGTTTLYKRLNEQTGEIEEVKIPISTFGRGMRGLMSRLKEEI